MKLNSKHKKELKRKEERKIKKTVSRGTYLVRKESIARKVNLSESRMKTVSEIRKEARTNLVNLNSLLK